MINELIKKYESMHHDLLGDYVRSAYPENVLVNLRTQMKMILDFIDDLKKIK